MKKLLALILSLTIAFSVFIPVNAEEEPVPSETNNHFENIELDSIKEYKAFLLKFARPAITTEQFLDLLKKSILFQNFSQERIFYPKSI